jgi:ribosomal-protein-alanine N-acetyltransferase
MTREDISAVLEIEQNSHVNPWQRKFFEEELNRFCSHLYVARTGGEPCIGLGDPTVSVESGLSIVVGYVCFWKVADEIQILNLAVHPAYRRRGIGRSLLLYALKRASELHGRVAILEARRSNEPALYLYKSVGFRVVGQRPRYYDEGPGGTAILMELELKPGYGQWIIGKGGTP